MIRWICSLCIVTILSLEMNAQIPGSIDISVGSYVDMRYVQRQNLKHSYSPGILFGVSYEFKLLNKFYIKSGFNIVSTNLSIENYKRQLFGSSNKYSEQIGQVQICGMYFEIPVSFVYYIQPRVLSVGGGVAMLSSFDSRPNYFYSEFRYLSDSGIQLQDPIVLIGQEDNLFRSDNNTSLFVSIGYNRKLEKYRYFSFVLRFGCVPFTGSTREAIVSRFFSFSIGYKFN